MIKMTLNGTHTKTVLITQPIGAFVPWTLKEGDVLIVDDTYRYTVAIPGMYLYNEHKKDGVPMMVLTRVGH